MNNIEAGEIARMLGGKRTLHRRIRTREELRETVESGLPSTALDRVVRRAAGEGLAAAELKQTIVPGTTLRRRRGWLCIEESRRLERLARMTVLAGKVWEDPARVRRFLTCHHPALGGERPCDLARNEAGSGRVEALLRLTARRSTGPTASSRTSPTASVGEATAEIRGGP